MHKVESVIPWLNDALVFFTVSLQLCQQLKDKVGAQGWWVWAKPQSQTDEAARQQPLHLGVFQGLLSPGQSTPRS